MNVVVSHATRTLLVRLTRGEPLVEALATLARDHHVGAATVVGRGVVQSITLEGYDPRAKGYGGRRTFSGAIELASLHGAILQGPGDALVQLHAAVVRDTDNGLEALGGSVVDAQVVAVDVTIFAHDDVRLSLQVDAATGLPAWRAEAASPRSAAAPPMERIVERTAPVVERTAPVVERATPVVERAAPVVERAPARVQERAERMASEPPGRGVAAPVKSLADAARALEAMPAREDAPDDEDTDFQPGDYVLHPAWGYCEVLRDSDAETLNIRLLDRGSTRTIKADIFDVEARPPKDGHRVWMLKPRGRA
ncbi:MAG: PPC domain-containing DNA-binding protein [Polyangiales bacterium]